MDYAKDARVDAYLDTLPAWQQRVCARARDIVHEADPGVEETIKRTTPHGIINQGQGNATARAIQVYEHDELDYSALLQLFRAVIANNRAGGWRKVKR